MISSWGWNRASLGWESIEFAVVVVAAADVVDDSAVVGAADIAVAGASVVVVAADDIAVMDNFDRMAATDCCHVQLWTIHSRVELESRVVASLAAAVADCYYSEMALDVDLLDILVIFLDHRRWSFDYYG